MRIKIQGEKAKERKDRRQSVLASGFKGGAAVREVGKMVIRMMLITMVVMIYLEDAVVDFLHNLCLGIARSKFVNFPNDLHNHLHPEIISDKKELSGLLSKVPGRSSKNYLYGKNYSKKGS